MGAPVPLVAGLVAGALLCVGVGARAATAAPAPATARGGGESQIDESSPDESSPGAVSPGAPATLQERLRDFVEGSLARYDGVKSEAPGFRRQGWYPSLFLRDPARDVAIGPGQGGGGVVTAHLSYARRELEQRIVVAPAPGFELPGADRRFFCELLGALATASPEIARARLVFWFGVLRPDGGMSWESRGALGLAAGAARKFPAGSRTPEAIWPLLDENSLVEDVWAPERAAGAGR